MLLILFLIIVQFVQTATIETTLPVSIVLDGFTPESWNEQFMWNKTRIILVNHLNSLCKKENHCDAEYGINNIHVLSVKPSGFSSIELNLTADEPIVNKPANPARYNYIALLTSALFQSKIDIEHLHDNQLLSTIVSSSTTSSSSAQNAIVNRTSRLLFVLLGITLVAIIFALTIVFFQRIHQHSYSRLLKTTTPTQAEILHPCPSTLP